MPVRIDQYIGQDREEIAWLCDDEWELPTQIAALQSWLLTSASALEPGEYVVDIGFSAKKNAAGGGSNLGNDALRRMAELGMSLELSEYPPFSEDERDGGT